MKHSTCCASCCSSWRRRSTEPGSKAPRSETIQQAVDDILSGMEVRERMVCCFVTKLFGHAVGWSK